MLPSDNDRLFLFPELEHDTGFPHTTLAADGIERMQVVTVQADGIATLQLDQVEQAEGSGGVVGTAHELVTAGAGVPIATDGVDVDPAVTTAVVHHVFSQLRWGWLHNLLGYNS